MKMTLMLFGGVVLVLGTILVAQDALNPVNSPTLVATFTVTKTPEDLIMELGTAEMVITAGGYGHITFTSKDGKLKVTRPVYPPGHVRTTAELEEEQNFQWPANITAEFAEFMVRKRDELENR